VIRLPGWIERLKLALEPPGCPACGETDPAMCLPPERHTAFCKLCWVSLGIQDRPPQIAPPGALTILAVTTWTGQTKSILYSHKFHRRPRSTRLMTQLLLDGWQRFQPTAPAHWQQRPVWIVPIPPRDPRRDPLAAVARPLAQRLGAQWTPCLQWRRPTQPQHTLHKKHQRLANLVDSLAVAPTALPQSAHAPLILIVDDLVTTGITMQQADRALRRHFQDAAEPPVLLGLAVCQMPYVARPKSVQPPVSALGLADRLARWKETEGLPD
jgi:predicted amidophosphoribosyltransferase